MILQVKPSIFSIVHIISTYFAGMWPGMISYFWGMCCGKKYQWSSVLMKLHITFVQSWQALIRSVLTFLEMLRTTCSGGWESVTDTSVPASVCFINSFLQCLQGEGGADRMIKWTIKWQDVCVVLYHNNVTILTFIILHNTVFTHSLDTWSSQFQKIFLSSSSNLI